MESRPHDPDWPLVSTVEELAFTTDHDDTPHPAEGAGSQFWNAPTPTLYMDSQGQSR